MSMVLRNKIIASLWGMVLLLVMPAGHLFAQIGLEAKSHGNIGVGFALKSNGYGMQLQMGKATRHYDIQRVITLDLVTAKHQREVKIINQGAQNPSAYVFGKLYHTFFARTAFGYGKSVIHRNYGNNLGVELMAVIGPTLAIQRPVYLDVMSFRLNDNVAIIRSERYNSQVHTNQNNIVGYTRKSKGWDEMKYTGGIGFRPGVNFYWGAYNQSFKQLHLGAMIDYFPTGMTIMAYGENPSTYVSPYLSFMWSFNRH